jgi:hypothetical protein
MMRKARRVADIVTKAIKYLLLNDSAHKTILVINPQGGQINSGCNGEFQE